MTALILQATPFVKMVALKPQIDYRRFLHALDVFAEVSMRKAVPARQLGKAEREINRYFRLMHTDHKSLANAIQTGVDLLAVPTCGGMASGARIGGQTRTSTDESARPSHPMKERFQ